MAIQLAKAFGSKVIVTVGSKDKADACLKLGAIRAINYKTEDFVAEVKSATNGAGANVILDMVAGDYVDRNYDAAAVDGRIVQIAVLGGAKVTVNIAKLMVKRLHHTGSTLRPRSNTDKAAMVAAIEARVMPLLREGRIKPLMDSTFPLEKAADAHRRMETSEHIGKIVLQV
jgi:NADPH2:quinone reductase